MNEVEAQRDLCRRYRVSWVAAPDAHKVGIALNVRDGISPIHGLRHPPAAGTTGWYLWAGDELSDADDFFHPLHVAHLREWCPDVLRFLGLPPGWRFLMAGDYVDVWEDPSLLAV